MMVLVMVMVMVTVMVMVKTNGGDDLTRFPLPPLSFNLGLVNGSAALLGLAHQVSVSPSSSPSSSSNQNGSCTASGCNGNTLFGDNIVQVEIRK